MLRRFVTGLVWGGVVAGLGLAVISQVAPRPDMPVKTAAEGTLTPQPEEAVTPPSAPDDAPSVTADTAASMPVEDPNKAEPAVAESASPDGAADGAETALSDASDATAPDTQPPSSDSTAPAPAAPATEAAPAPVDAPAEAELAVTAPVLPDGATDEAETALSDAPDATAPDTQPPSSDPTAPGTNPAPAQVAAQSTAPEALTAPSPSPAVDSPAQDIQPAPPPEAVAEEPLLSPAPAAGDAPGAILPAPPPTEVAQDLPRLLTPNVDPGPPGDLALALPDVQPGSSSLPQIGEAPAPAATANDAVPEVAVIDDLPPIAAFARPFENPEAKPLFALLLVDDGRADLDRATLAALPFPVTFVVDPQAPNAAEAAAIYRAGLQEVVMTASGLPDGAEPADIEQSFEANAAILPETVAVIDTGPGGRLEDRTIASAVVPILLDQGRGLITYDLGLNAADQVARRAALPTVALFRLLDGEGESQPTIRRYLDRAAFKAAQEGQVVVMGSTRPETVAAILEWTVEGRAASVALAPITAVLAAQ